MIDSEYLMTYDEYVKNLDHPRPYVYSVSNNDQRLVYFGFQHSNDPTNIQFDQLRVHWENFISDTRDSDRKIAFNEGGNPPVLEDEKMEINMYGDSGYIRFLAKKDEVETISPEPDKKEEIEKLLEDYNKDYIFYYYFVRQVTNWARTIPREDFEIYVKHTLDSLKELLKWRDYDFSFSHVKQIHSDLFDRPFTEEDIAFLNKAIDPTLPDSIINRISAKCNFIRDVNMVDKIYSYWKQGYNIFVVYGSTHAVMQERAIRYYCK